MEISGANPARRRQQRPNLAAPDEATAADLDALELARPRPSTDRLAAEANVRRRQHVGGLGEGDPIRRGSSHRRQSVELELELEPPAELDVPEPSALVAGVDFVSVDFFSVVADSPPDEAVRSAEALPSAPPSLAPAPSFERALARALEPRSFLAQPLPLKWTDGAEKTFVIVPSAPHSGQK
jgi:hypothetical protein